MACCELVRISTRSAVARAAFEIHVVGDDAAQRFDSLRVAMCQGLDADFPAHLPFQPLPERKRKGPGFRNPGRKGLRRQHLAHPAAAEHGVSALAEVGGLVAQQRFPSNGPMAGREFRDLRHETAAADAALDEAFGVKPAIGRFDGIPRHTQRRGKGTRGRQGLSCPKRPVDDQLPDGALDSFVKGHGRMSGMSDPRLRGFQLGMPEQMV